MTFGEHKRLLVLIDANGNGIYNDLMKANRWHCDSLLFGGNKDRKEGGGLDREEAEPLGRFVLVAGKFWKLDVAADGSSVAIERLNKPLGTIRSVHKDFNVLLAGDDGAMRVRSRDGAARLPHGTYSLAHCQYHLADNAGRRWELVSYATDKTMPVNVPTDKTVSLLGPPFVPKVLANLSGAELSMNLELRGAGGEVYSAVNLGEDKRPPAPKVRITDSGGRELAILDFHYG